jgi:hypothetical protein
MGGATITSGDGGLAAANTAAQGGGVTNQLRAASVPGVVPHERRAGLV